MTAFYLVELPRCACGKPATKRIEGTGNVVWVSALCDRCAAKRLAELKAAHA